MTYIQKNGPFKPEPLLRTGGNEALVTECIIYDPKVNDNEEKSQEMFEEFAKEVDLQENTVSSIKDMILLTKHHTTEAHKTPGLYGQQDHHYFLDFDMAILGSCPEDYVEYARKIRQEYIHVPEDVYRSTRAHILKEFLKTPNIFATRELRGEFENQSRRNIQDEIQRLESNKPI